MSPDPALARDAASTTVAPRPTLRAATRRRTVLRGPVLRAFWALYAQVYDTIWDSPMTRLLAQAVLASAATTRDVVDLGCGTGLVARELTSAGKAVVGVDSSSAMLHRARQRGRVSAALLSDAVSTPLAGGSAGTVLLCNVLHLQQLPEACLVEAVRVAGPGAAIVLTWPVDGLTHAQARRADFGSGRGLLATVRADVLRRAVAVAFSVVPAPRADEARLMAAVHGVVDDGHVTFETHRSLLGCQRMVVLRRSPSSRPGRQPQPRDR